jgi:mannose-6-phosphate isomerase-like protein (cupin superfamily)
MRFEGDIDKAARGNTAFRRVLATGEKSQLVVMSIPAGEDIGSEIHPNTDQILFIVEGKGKAVVNGKTTEVEENAAVFVPAGAKHNLVNHGRKELKLFTVYSPPEHPDGTVHRTKAEALAAEHA